MAIPSGGRFALGENSLIQAAHGGGRGGIGDDLIESGDVRNFAIGFDRKFHGVALQIIVLRVEGSSSGIVGVGLRRGAGFFVSGAQACGAGRAVRRGLQAHDVEAHIQLRNLFQLSTQLPD